MVTLVNIVGSYYLQGILDDYIPHQMRSTLGIISIGLVVSYVLQQMMTYARDYLLTILSQRFTIDVILSYVRHIFDLPMSFFATRQTGEVTSRFSDANSIIDALASTILSLFFNVPPNFSDITCSKNIFLCYSYIGSQSQIFQNTSTKNIGLLREIVNLPTKTFFID